MLAPARDGIDGDQKNDGVITWDDFRFSLNKFYWVKPDLNSTNQRIKELYYTANKKIYSSELPAAKELLFKAIKIESELGATETDK